MSYDEKMNELVINNLQKCFKEKKAVDNINLTLKNGVYGLLGENGAGKTTLMRLITGLLKETTGEILYNKTNIKKLGSDYRNIIGYLPQEFGYYQEYSAESLLHYFAILKGLPKECIKIRVKELLKLVGLSDVNDKKLDNFSGGMLRRFGVAYALLNDPDVLILDEPTSGLDPKERIRFRNIISTLSKNKIILLSTHIVSDIEHIADKILIMRKGKIIEFGEIEDVILPVYKKVWSLEIEDNVDEYESKYLVSNLKIKEKSTVLRIISSEKPAGNALAVKPTLEDAYLYYVNNYQD